METEPTPTGYEHVPTVADLEEIKALLETVTPRNDGHAADLAEDIASLTTEIERRR